MVAVGDKNQIVLATALGEILFAEFVACLGSAASWSQPAPKYSTTGSACRAAATRVKVGSEADLDATPHAAEATPSRLVGRRYAAR
jgi:hypothetical protein